MVLSLKYFKKIARILKPRIEIGGLDINDGSISFLSLDPETKRSRQISLTLEQGIIIGGKIKEPSQFIKTLKELHSRITPNRSKKIHVVVSLSDANVYTQHFALPLLQSSSLKEAVQLNLQVLSPIDFSKAYSDWQQVPATQNVDNQVDILASFSEKEIIDSFYNALSNSQFLPVAIEQKMASLTRAITKLSAGYDPQKSHFLLYVNSDGVGFSIIKNSSLYFDRFTLWSALIKENSQSKQITLKEFGDIIVQESHQVVNYYSSRFHDAVTSLYVVAPGFEEQVKNIMVDQFSLTIEPLALKEYVLDISWLAALGASLRGLTSRSLDTDVSLAPEDTEIQFLHSQIIEFVSLWRNIILATLFIVLAASVGTYLFLNYLIGGTVKGLNISTGSYSEAHLSTLTSEANSFNQVINQALLARQKQTRWSHVLSDIVSKESTTAFIDHLYVQSPGLPVILNGRANTSNDAVDFKNRIASLSYISNVDLPLSSLILNGNQVSFSISFNVNASGLQQ